MCDIIHLHIYSQETFNKILHCFLGLIFRVLRYDCGLRQTQAYPETKNGEGRTQGGGTSRTWPSLCYGRGQHILKGMTPVTDLAFWAHCALVKQNHALPRLLVSDPSQTIPTSSTNRSVEVWSIDKRFKEQNYVIPVQTTEKEWCYMAGVNMCAGLTIHLGKAEGWLKPVLT